MSEDQLGVATGKGSWGGNAKIGLGRTESQRQYTGKREIFCIDKIYNPPGRHRGMNLNTPNVSLSADANMRS